MSDFKTVEEFERQIAAFFGAPFAVACNSCTTGLEICLHYKKAKYITCPTRTYLSVPMLAKKLGIKLEWDINSWKDYYELYPGIYDAAVLWRRDSYLPDSLMCISFQFQKHLSLSGGGVILCPTKQEYDVLKRLSHDGREPGIPWREQNIQEWGLHGYMSEEMAAAGLKKLPWAIETPPKEWYWEDWNDLLEMDVFK